MSFNLKTQKILMKKGEINMKKKIFAGIMFAMLFVSACGNTAESVNAKQDQMMEHVDSGCGYDIYADKETGVMYFATFSSGGGGVAIMQNADGTPKIYDFGK